MKKIIVLFLSLSFLNGIIVLAEENQNAEKASNDNQVLIEMTGPKGKPFVKGPTSPPPSNEEILKMRGVWVEKS